MPWHELLGTGTLACGTGIAHERCVTASGLTAKRTKYPASVRRLGKPSALFLLLLRLLAGFLRGFFLCAFLAPRAFDACELLGLRGLYCGNE